MSVSREDVRHVAQLARLGVPPEQLDALVAELSGILAHMDTLQGADTSALSVDVDAQPGLLRRADEGPSAPLSRTRESVAPLMRDGFFLVPRLATHDGAEEES